MRAPWTVAVTLAMAGLCACTAPQRSPMRSELPNPFLRAAATPAPRPQPTPMPAPAPASPLPATPTALAVRAGLPAFVVPDGGVSSKWRYIVIHHSATVTGDAAAFHRAHLANGWENGLGYHFVIGNGSGTGDGEIEQSARWQRQMTGAHCKTSDNRYNDFGVGICLIGNFEFERPTEAQMASLERLVRFLSETCRISATHMLQHRDCCDTRCPGRHFSLDHFRRRLASADGPAPAARSVGAGM